MRDRLWPVCGRWQLRLRPVTGETAADATETIVALEDASLRADLPRPDFATRPRVCGRVEFASEAARDCDRCPERTRVSPAPVAAATVCLRKPQGTTSAKGRQVKRRVDEADLERVRGYHGTEAYATARRHRQGWGAPLCAEAQAWHGLRRVRLSGLE